MADDVAEEMTTEAKVEMWEAASPDFAERVSILREAGLSDKQIITLIEDPLSVPMEWETTTVTSPNVRVVETPIGEGPPAVAPVEDQGASRAGSARAGTVCGWAITNHHGSTYGIRAATLMLRTDWCWKQGSIQGTPLPSHHADATVYGHGAGWRVANSYNGSNGWIGPRYKTEAKANWTVQACLPIPPFPCQQVDSGTAWAWHNVTGSGMVSKNQGGWSY